MSAATNCDATTRLRVLSKARPRPGHHHRPAPAHVQLPASSTAKPTGVANERPILSARNQLEAMATPHALIGDDLGVLGVIAIEQSALGTVESDSRPIDASDLAVRRRAQDKPPMRRLFAAPRRLAQTPRSGTAFRLSSQFDWRRPATHSHAG